MVAPVIRLFDPAMNAFNNVYHQGFINDEHVRVDADGKVRLVLGPNDPGIENWLDTGGWRKGGALWCWNTATSAPIPKVTVVKLADVKHFFPKGTPALSPERRKAATAMRAAYYGTRAT